MPPRERIKRLKILLNRTVKERSTRHEDDRDVDLKQVLSEIYKFEI